MPETYLKLGNYQVLLWALLERIANACVMAVSNDTRLKTHAKMGD